MYKFKDLDSGKVQIVESVKLSVNRLQITNPYFNAVVTVDGYTRFRWEYGVLVESNPDLREFKDIVSPADFALASTFLGAKIDLVKWNGTTLKQRQRKFERALKRVRETETPVGYAVEVATLPAGTTSSQELADILIPSMSSVTSMLHGLTDYQPSFLSDKVKKQIDVKPEDRFNWAAVLYTDSGHSCIQKNVPLHLVAGKTVLNTCPVDRKYLVLIERA